jgi:hypothetical protein
MEDWMREGPSSDLTSSAFFSKLGGRPIGFSIASNEAGRFNDRKRLMILSNLVRQTIDLFTLKRHHLDVAREPKSPPLSSSSGGLGKFLELRVSNG